MKKTFILTLAAAMLPLLSHATDLMPESCSVGNRPFVYPLEEISFQFDGAIELSDLSYACIRQGDQTVAVADHCDVSNYVGSTRTQGTFIIFFEKQLLPLGGDYVLQVAPGSVHRQNSPTDSNPMLEIPFSVPADLGDHSSDITTGQVIEDARHIWVYWGTETKAVGEPEWTLYRNGEVEGTYPAHVAWDWDLGQAYVDFGEKKTFDRDVRYSLVLPAGSVSSCYRDDMVNREVRLEFVGGYDGPQPNPLVYTWCSLYTDHPTDGRLGIVRFIYDRPIIVKEGGKVLLYEMDPERLVAEAEAYIDDSVNCFHLCCDFGGFQMNPGSGYTFVIPEGTVMAADDSGDVNPRQTYSIDHSGIDSVIGDETTGDETVYDMMGRAVKETLPGAVYIRGGKKFIGK